MFRDPPVTDLEPARPTSAPPPRRTAEDASAPGPLVVICFVCRSFKDDDRAWSPAHTPIGIAPERPLTHGLCPSCLERLYPDAPAPPASHA